MNKLNCRITWSMVNDTASDANNHLIISSDCSPLSNILPETEIASKPNYRSDDVLNNQLYPQQRLATLETDFWKMDGSMKLPERSSGQVLNKGEIGWVSNSVCDASGNFTAGNEPTLVIRFDNTDNNPINLTGLNFTFFEHYGEYPLEFDMEVDRQIQTGIETLYLNGATANNYLLNFAFSDVPVTDANGTGIAEDFSAGIRNIKEIRMDRTSGIEVSSSDKAKAAELKAVAAQNLIYKEDFDWFFNQIRTFCAHYEQYGGGFQFPNVDMDNLTARLFLIRRKRERLYSRVS